MDLAQKMRVVSRNFWRVVCAMAAVFAITCLIGCGGGGSVEPAPAATPPPAATPDPTPAENIEVDVAAVTASAFQSPNVAENVIAQSSDNASRWSLSLIHI